MHLPIYTHPTMTVLLDGGNLGRRLSPCLHSISFGDGDAALAWLARQQRGNALAPRVHFDSAFPAAGHCNIAIDIDNLHHLTHRAQRFLTPAVLVVDGRQAQLDSLGVLRAASHLPCKKILLGEAGADSQALDAFNHGLIDRYIDLESSPPARLEHEIAALQKAFFASQSNPLRELLVMQHFHFLADTAFRQLIQQLTHQHGFIEHYLFPSPTGLIFFDQQGKASLMIVETAESMRTHYEVARDSDAPASLQEALAQCRVIPYFGGAGGDGMYAPRFGGHWHRYCQAPQVCVGDDTYLWALFDLPEHYLQAPAFSYARFLREQSAAHATAAADQLHSASLAG